MTISSQRQSQARTSRNPIFMEALAATARVACAVVLVGCARTPLPEPGTIDSAQDTGSVDTAQDTGSVDTGSTDTGSTDTGTDTGSTDTGTDTGLGECTADSLVAQVAAGASDAEILDCCETLAVDWEFSSIGGDTYMACCQLLNWDSENFPGCTAWGPPRPPSMGQRLYAARKVRAVRAAALAGVA